MHFFLNGVLKKAIYILFLQHWGTKIKNKHNKGKKKEKKKREKKKREREIWSNNNMDIGSVCG